MERVVICVDNSENESEKYQLSEFDKLDQLEQQLITVLVICRPILTAELGNVISILEFSPKARIIQSFTRDWNKIYSNINKVSVEEGLDFLTGLWMAYTALKSSELGKKRVIIFIKNPIIYSDNDLKNFSTKLLKENSDLNLDVVCFGDNCYFNAEILRYLSHLLKPMYLRIYEIHYSTHQLILKELIDTSVLRITQKEYTELIKDLTIFSNNFKGFGTGLRFNVDLDLCPTEDLKLNIELMRKQLNDNKDINEIDRKAIEDLICKNEETDKQSKQSVSVTSNLKYQNSTGSLVSDVNTAQQFEDSLRKAIENSLKENYKNNNLDKDLSISDKNDQKNNDNQKNANKNQNTSQTQMKKITKFREGKKKQ